MAAYDNGGWLPSALSRVTLQAGELVLTMRQLRAQMDYLNGAFAGMGAMTGTGSPGVHGFSERGDFDFAVGQLYGVRVWDLKAGAKLAGHHEWVWAQGENLAVCPNAAALGPVLVLATDAAYARWLEDHRIHPADPRLVHISSMEQLDAKCITPDATWIEISDGFLRLQHVVALREALSLRFKHGDVWETVRRLQSGPDRPHEVPGPNSECGCGFWAYWTCDMARSVFKPPQPVLGVIKGYGRTRIGDRGFRCSKAQIVGLCLAFDFQVPDRDNVKSQVEMMLERAYPSAKVYATPQMMLLKHPLTKDYLREPDVMASPNMPVCAGGLPLSRIERQMVDVSTIMDPHMIQVPGSGIRAWHADGSECEHMSPGAPVRFSTGGGAGGGGSSSFRGGRWGGSGGVNVSGGSAGWTPVSPVTQAQHNSAWAQGIAKGTRGGGGGTIQNLP